MKKLRELTGAGMMDCKKALDEADGDFDKAAELIRVKLGKKMAERGAEREASAGLVAASGGALVELNCETDFVARDEGFRALAHELAMQIAASADTEFVLPEDAPAEMPDDEKKLKVLYMQAYIKNPSQSVKDLIIERAARFGENVRVRRFVRFELGA